MRPNRSVAGRERWLPWVTPLVLILGPHALVSLHGAELSWDSSNRYRVLLTVDPRGVTRSNSPASVDVDLAGALAAVGSMETFDRHTIEIIGYDSAGNPRVFDASRTGDEQLLLPWRVQEYYGISQITLSLVVPDETCVQYAVYFDSTESGLGKPQRYAGIVGNGDRFTEGYKRREVNASGYDNFADFDGDGDLDLFKGGTEPYVYCYENVGGNRFVDRGRLTSYGSLLVFPHDGNNRSWDSVEFFDWDGDGDQDMFVHSPTGPYASHVIRFENVTLPGGPPRFTNLGPLLTQSGHAIGTAISFVDWDGDGLVDVMGGRDWVVTFYRNIGSQQDVQDMQLADGAYVHANGVEIQLGSPRMDFPDIDNDGDLDLFVGTEEGRIFWFENVGTRTAPVFTPGRLIAFYEYMDARAGVKVADFDGDGLLDFVPGRYWERTQWGEQPRVYGRLYKNVGTPTGPRFEARDAYGGSPYTKQFQICDAVRQNGVRAVDWNNDGRTDLIAGDTDGFVWCFENQTNHLFPVFAAGRKLQAGGRPLRVYGEEREGRAAGYARCDICDWNNDGKMDLLVADGRGWLTLYLNQGTDAAPVLDQGTRVVAHDLPIDGTARGSVLVCDWNNDGMKDVIFGMVGEGELSCCYDWPHRNPDPGHDSGFLYYENTGTDASPVLASPEWIMAGGSVIDYTRPNLGDFVDWDGDGDRDFIACEFEHNVRLYENTGSGAPGIDPQFTSSVGGTYLVQPWTVQMISGADAIDWNRDGDIDIITGQGHGGSGLRLYERDFIEDFINGTPPIVTVGQTEHKCVRADIDGDGDVDQEDFGLMQICLSGTSVPREIGCEYADFDNDLAVDENDVAIFRACVTGANIPAYPGCAD